MPALLLRSPFTSTVGQDPTTITNDSMSIPADFIAAASICLFLTVSAVCLRVFTKVVDLRRVQVEDYAIILAGAGFVAFMGLLFTGSGAGLGRNDTTLSFEQRKRALQFSNGLDIVNTPIMFFVKIAILIQLDRLFSGARKTLVYWGVRALMAINAVFYSAMLFVYIFACNPRSKLFDSNMDGTCIDQSASMISTASVDIASNSIILIISIWGVSTLQLSVKRQTLVALVLGLGSFACIASVCRLVYGVKIGTDENYAAAIWPVHLWSLAELTSLILCACCPTFPHLYRYTQGERTPKHSKWPMDKKSSVDIPLFDLEKQTPKKGTMSKKFIKATKPTSDGLSRNVSASLPKRSKSQNTGRFNPRANSPSTSTTPSRSTSRTSSKLTTRHPPRSFSRNRDRTSSPTPIEPHKALPCAPIRHISNARHPLQTMSVYDENDSIDVAPITPSSPTQSHFPLSPTSTHAPISPAQTEFSVAQTEFSVAEVEDARPMRILPVYFATIRKTVSVRISSHTNLGSPMSWRKPSFGW
ncbi:hypothetical protein CC80DRAFT_550043 [Byssothecium circinans]|uniref:Rhodopsin domain-containing protein n=1 Tax=Byssothecium circinans TaxID=147558 RepID=A0A6A5TQE6_9PLEO|nr:hypothetical protein CC80DRAFT_550043 [Byssothecium circinans]